MNIVREISNFLKFEGFFLVIFGIDNSDRLNGLIFKNVVFGSEDYTGSHEIFSTLSFELH